MLFQRLTIATVVLAASSFVDLASAQVVVINQGLVTVTATDAAETILISQVGDQIIVDINGGQTPFDADDVQAISIDALGGDDIITVNVNRPTTILGGVGNDTITGSDGGADLAVGQQGADTFSGRGGDDSFVWNPGDGNDLIDGDDGNDTHIFNGSAAAEIIDIEPNGPRVLLTRNIANIVMDIGTFENITVNALAGEDTVSGAAGLSALLELLTIDGGADNDILTGGDGDDVLQGGAGDDMLFGGDGNDTIDGDQGADTAFMGAGDDVFIWDPGDGSDFVEGEAGFDTLLFNGSAGNEIFDASPNGSRLRFFRNLGNIIMDVGTTEQIDLRAFGGDDATTINDLDGTDVTDVIVDAGPGNDTFVGSALPETFLGGEGDDTTTMGDGDFFDMGAGIDELHFFGTTGKDNIHVDAKTDTDHDEAFFHGTIGNQLAVFDNGEIVTVFTQGGDDKVKVHNKAANLWDIEIVE
ncbi:MAG: hypothetical protein L0Y42_07815 [Phycisphaerales bacterium]|nr:hypothetical protein [Phycisphaerales bacterium]